MLCIYMMSYKAGKAIKNISCRIRRPAKRPLFAMSVNRSLPGFTLRRDAAPIGSIVAPFHEGAMVQSRPRQTSRPMSFLDGKQYYRCRVAPREEVCPPATGLRPVLLGVLDLSSL